MSNTHTVVFLIGVFLVWYALTSTPVSTHYVSDLEGWEYVRTYNVVFDSTHTMPLVVILPLPADDDFWRHVKPDGGDIRVTVGSGVSEEILPTMLIDYDYFEKKGKIAVLTDVPSENMSFRLYYGNHDAVAPEPFAIYKNKSFYAFDTDRDLTHWEVFRYSDDTSGECYYYRGHIYLAKGEEKACVMKYRENVPYAEGTLGVYAYTNSKQSGGLVIWLYREIPEGFVPAPGEHLGFDDVNGMTVGGYGYETDAYPNEGHDPSTSDHVALIQDSSANHVQYRNLSSNSRWYYVIFKDDHFTLKYPNVVFTKEIPVPHKESFPFIISGATGKEGGDVRLTYFYFRYATTSPVQTFISPEQSATSSPEIAVKYPIGDEVYGDNSVAVDVYVSDPNSDMNMVIVYVDDNILVSRSERSSFSYSSTVTLEDGEHTLRVVAKDSEGLESTVTVPFFVDTVSPALDVADVNYYDGTLSFTINAEDPTLSRCYYFTTAGGEYIEISCSGAVDVQVPFDTTDVFIVAEDRAENVTVANIPLASLKSTAGVGTTATDTLSTYPDSGNSDFPEISSEQSSAQHPVVQDDSTQYDSAQDLATEDGAMEGGSVEDLNNINTVSGHASDLVSIAQTKTSQESESTASETSGVSPFADPFFIAAVVFGGLAVWMILLRK